MLTNTESDGANLRIMDNNEVVTEEAALATNSYVQWTAIKHETMETPLVDNFGRNCDKHMHDAAHYEKQRFVF